MEIRSDSFPYRTVTTSKTVSPPISLLQKYIREDLASLSDNIHFEMYYKYDGNSYFELVAELIFIFECDYLEIPLKALLSSNIHWLWRYGDSAMFWTMSRDHYLSPEFISFDFISIVCDTYSWEFCFYTRYFSHIAKKKRWTFYNQLCTTKH